MEHETTNSIAAWRERQLRNHKYRVQLEMTLGHYTQTNHINFGASAKQKSQWRCTCVVDFWWAADKFTKNIAILRIMILYIFHDPSLNHNQNLQAILYKYFMYQAMWFIKKMEA